MKKMHVLLEDELKYIKDTQFWVGVASGAVLIVGIISVAIALCLYFDV